MDQFSVVAANWCLMSLLTGVPRLLINAETITDNYESPIDQLIQITGLLKQGDNGRAVTIQFSLSFR